MARRMAEALKDEVARNRADDTRGMGTAKRRE
jgi:hypothetical protein